MLVFGADKGTHAPRLRQGYSPKREPLATAQASLSSLKTPPHGQPAVGVQDLAPAALEVTRGNSPRGMLFYSCHPRYRCPRRNLNTI